VAKRELLVQQLISFGIEAFPVAFSNWLRAGSQCYPSTIYVTLLLHDDYIFSVLFSVCHTSNSQREKIACSPVSKFSKVFLQSCKIGMKFNHYQQSNT